jgi:hypothetical protein
MAGLIISYLISLGAVLLLILSGYNLDKNLPDKKVFYFCKAPKFILAYNKFYKKQERNKFLLYSVILQYFAYLAAIINITILIIALISKNSDIMFISAVSSWIITAITTVHYIIEMVLAEIFYKKDIGDI